jgi:hypothetical protein
MLKDNFNNTQAAEIRLDAIAGLDRIEARAGAGRDDLTRLQAAAFGDC